jgi:uncharacterized protein (TIGR02117 family)
VDQGKGRAFVKWTVRALAVLVSVPILYLLAALIGGLIPANRNWQPPARGITIFVETNGVHTWIAVPTVSDEMDWRSITPATDLRDPSLTGNYRAFGYGNRAFYLNTPEWKDLTMRRALDAVFGNGPTLMHVYHERDPQTGEDVRPITLSSDQYRRLSAFIVDSFDLTNRGGAKPLIGRGYGQDDAFYEAEGRYNLFYTCNEWTGAALRTAGVKIGLWTPFSQSVMARFR